MYHLNHINLSNIFKIFLDFNYMLQIYGLFKNYTHLIACPSFRLNLNPVFY
jgi:hypothetical protein